MIDVAHSYVEFQIRYLGLFTFGGRFSGLAGTLVFDKDHWDTLESQIEIPVDTLQARPSLWRATLLGPVYFDESHFPTIEFAATHAERTGPTTGEAFCYSSCLRGLFCFYPEPHFFLIYTTIYVGTG